ncbi:hypothetical protein RS9916_29874 [Synechococcus sp. RS9916]|nr:hypothetical protein RS9916_29874 [Synechococcus sp. RS9916]
MAITRELPRYRPKPKAPRADRGRISPAVNTLLVNSNTLYT